MKKSTIISLDIFQTLVDVNQRIPQIWKGILGEAYTPEKAYAGAKAVMSCYQAVVAPCLASHESFRTMEEVFLDCAREICSGELTVSAHTIVENLCRQHGLAPFYEEVREVIPTLKQKNCLVIASDSNHLMADPIVQQVQPDYAFLSDDLECYKGEPSGRFFLIMAQQLQVRPEEIIHIGDSVSDIVGAKAAGAKAVWLNRGKKQWKRSILPDYEIASLREIENLL